MLRWKRTLATALLVAGIGAHPASAAWLEPADLAPANPPAKSVGAPSLAVARDGTAFAAFQRFDGDNLRVAVAMRVPSGGFGAALDLTPAGRDAFNPAIAVDRQGNATLAWMQAPGFVVQARFRPAGGDWGEPTLLSVGPISRGPSVAVSDDGAAVVAWGRNTGGQVAQVEAAIRRSAGQPFGSALPVSPAAGTGLCGTPRVAIDAGGNVAAIWTRRTSASGDYHVESAVKPAGSVAFAPAEPRSTTAGNSDCHAEIAMTPEGRATAMWDFAETGKPSFIAVADRGPAGPWGPATKVSALANRSITPVFALDEAGDAAAAWLSGGQVVSAVRAGLSPFSLPKPLSGATELSGLAVGTGAAGEALAAFVGDSNGSDAIFVARRHAGGEFGAVEPVALTPPPGGAMLLSAPDIGLDDEGNAFAVWQRRVVGTDTSSVQVAPFDPVPPALTAADVPAAATAGQPVAMSAAASDRMSSPALRFDFGDGSAADGAAVQHIYGAEGTYNVTVTATDAAGNRSSTTRAIQVAAAPEPRPGPGTGGGGSTGGDTEPKRVFAAVAASWDRLRNGRTRMLELSVNELDGPETVRLTCDTRKRGCRRSATKTVSKHRRKVDFTKAVKGMILRPDATLTVTVTRPGYVARIFTYTMVKFANPKKKVRCLPPGAKRLRTC